MQRDALSVQPVAFQLLVLPHAYRVQLVLTLEQLVSFPVLCVLPVFIPVLDHHRVCHVVPAHTQLKGHHLVHLALLVPIHLQAHLRATYVHLEVSQLLELHLVLYVLSACLQQVLIVRPSHLVLFVLLVILEL